MRSARRRIGGGGPAARAFAVAFGLWAGATGPLAGQATDTVRVELAADGARIELRIPNIGESIEAFAMRFPDQDVRVTEVRREGEALLDAMLTREAGALRFAVASGAPVVVRYEVTGPVARIPLFVPGGEAVLTVAGAVEEPYLIRVSGSPDAMSAIETDTSLPRFTRLDDGTLEARLSSLPSFIRLSPGGPLSFPRLADALAILLIAVGAFLAVRRIRRAMRTEPTASGP